MKDKISKKLKESLPGVLENVLLKKCTSYKIGGPADYFFAVKNEEDLSKALKAAKQFKLPFFILAGGSNVLFSDDGFRGLIINIKNQELKISENIVFAGSGAKLNDFADFCAKNNLTGVEWSQGIPGTVGGAIYGNAQAFGQRISDSVKNVQALDIKTFEIHPVKSAKGGVAPGAQQFNWVKNFAKKDCDFSLKNSLFKKNKNLIIISASFCLQKADPKGILEKTAKNLQYRKSHHPLNFPSAGSVFVNPEKIIKNKKLLEKFPELAEFNKAGTIPAGYLIQKAGLRGKRVGGAQISKMHANFIINLGDAKAKDVLALIKLAKAKVKKIFGISLQTEVQII